MKPIVEKLWLDDMISIVAYAASLSPRARVRSRLSDALASDVLGHRSDKADSGEHLP
jgi:hypothetical protein